MVVGWVVRWFFGSLIDLVRFIVAAEARDSCTHSSISHPSTAAPQALRQRYRVESFPTLLFVDADSGRVVARDVRQSVMADPNGDGFPYMPPIESAKKFAKGLWTTLVPKLLRDEIRDLLQANPITNLLGKLLKKIPI